MNSLTEVLPQNPINSNTFFSSPIQINSISTDNPSLFVRPADVYIQKMIALGYMDHEGNLSDHACSLPIPQLSDVQLKSIQNVLNKQITITQRSDGKKSPIDLSFSVPLGEYLKEVNSATKGLENKKPLYDDKGYKLIGGVVPHCLRKEFIKRWLTATIGTQEDVETLINNDLGDQMEVPPADYDIRIKVKDKSIDLNAFLQKCTEVLAKHSNIEDLKSLKSDLKTINNKLQEYLDQLQKEWLEQKQVKPAPTPSNSPTFFKNTINLIKSPYQAISSFNTSNWWIPSSSIRIEQNPKNQYRTDNEYLLEQILNKAYLLKKFRLNRQFSIISIGDRSNFVFDLLFTDDLKRNSLFRRDSLRICIGRFLESGKIEDLELESDFPIAQILSDLNAQIIHVPDFTKITEDDWSTLMSRMVTKGERCLVKDTEKRLYQYIVDKAKETNTALATFIIQLLGKRFQNHHDNHDPYSKIALAFRGCTSMKNNGATQNEIKDAWIGLTKDVKVTGQQLGDKIYNALKNKKITFEQVLVCLEVGSFIFLNAATPNRNNPVVFSKHEGDAVNITLKGKNRNFHIWYSFNSELALKRISTWNKMPYELQEILNIFYEWSNEFYSNKSQLKNHLLSLSINLETLTNVKNSCLQNQDFSLCTLGAYLEMTCQSLGSVQSPAFLKKLPRLFPEIPSSIDRLRLAKRISFHSLGKVIEKVNPLLNVKKIDENQFLHQWIIALGSLQNESVWPNAIELAWNKTNKINILSIIKELLPIHISFVIYLFRQGFKNLKSIEQIKFLNTLCIAYRKSQTHLNKEYDHFSLQEMFDMIINSDFKELAEEERTLVLRSFIWLTKNRIHSSPTLDSLSAIIFCTEKLKIAWTISEQLTEKELLLITDLLYKFPGESRQQYVDQCIEQFLFSNSSETFPHIKNFLNKKISQRDQTVIEQIIKCKLPRKDKSDLIEAAISKLDFSINSTVYELYSLLLNDHIRLLYEDFSRTLVIFYLKFIDKIKKSRSFQESFILSLIETLKLTPKIENSPSNHDIWCALNPLIIEVFSINRHQFGKNFQELQLIWNETHSNIFEALKKCGLNEQATNLLIACKQHDFSISSVSQKDVLDFLVKDLITKSTAKLENFQVQWAETLVDSFNLHEDLIVPFILLGYLLVVKDEVEVSYKIALKLFNYSKIHHFNTTELLTTLMIKLFDFKFYERCMNLALISKFSYNEKIPYTASHLFLEFANSRKKARNALNTFLIVQFFLSYNIINRQCWDELVFLSEKNLTIDQAQLIYRFLITNQTYNTIYSNDLNGCCKIFTLLLKKCGQESQDFISSDLYKSLKQQPRTQSICELQLVICSTLLRSMKSKYLSQQAIPIYEFMHLLNEQALSKLSSNLADLFTLQKLELLDYLFKERLFLNSIMYECFITLKRILNSTIHDPQKIVKTFKPTPFFTQNQLLIHSVTFNFFQNSLTLIDTSLKPNDHKEFFELVWIFYFSQELPLNFPPEKHSKDYFKTTSVLLETLSLFNDPIYKINFLKTFSVDNLKGDVDKLNAFLLNEYLLLFLQIYGSINNENTMEKIPKTIGQFFIKIHKMIISSQLPSQNVDLLALNILIQINNKSLDILNKLPITLGSLAIFYICIGDLFRWIDIQKGIHPNTYTENLDKISLLLLKNNYPQNFREEIGVLTFKYLKQASGHFKGIEILQITRPDLIKELTHSYLKSPHTVILENNSLILYKSSQIQMLAVTPLLWKILKQNPSLQLIQQMCAILTSALDNKIYENPQEAFRGASPLPTIIEKFREYIHFARSLERREQIQVLTALQQIIIHPKEIHSSESEIYVFGYQENDKTFIFPLINELINEFYLLATEGNQVYLIDDVRIDMATIALNILFVTVSKGIFNGNISQYQKYINLADLIKFTNCHPKLEIAPELTLLLMTRLSERYSKQLFQCLLSISKKYIGEKDQKELADINNKKFDSLISYFESIEKCISEKNVKIINEHTDKIKPLSEVVSSKHWTEIQLLTVSDTLSFKLANTSAIIILAIYGVILSARMSKAYDRRELVHMNVNILRKILVLLKLMKKLGIDKLDYSTFLYICENYITLLFKIAFRCKGKIIHSFYINQDKIEEYENDGDKDGEIIPDKFEWSIIEMITLLTQDPNLILNESAKKNRSALLLRFIYHLPNFFPEYKIPEEIKINIQIFLNSQK